MTMNNMLANKKESLVFASNNIFLSLLLVGDAFFVVLHFVLSMTSWIESSLFLISEDHGYAEFYQYVKMLWLVVLLGGLSSKVKEKGYIAWAILYAYLLIDDALTVHERLGAVIAERLGFISMLGLRAQDFGELLVISVPVIACSGLIFLFYKSGTKTFRRTSETLFYMTCFLAFFGIFLDMLHIMFASNRMVNIVIGVLEDGGEMVVVSLIVTYIFARCSLFTSDIEIH